MIEACEELGCVGICFVVVDASSDGDLEGWFGEDSGAEEGWSGFLVLANVPIGEV